MTTLRNLPVEKAMQLSELIQVRPHQVVSMALTRSDSIQMMLFAFAEHESVSEEAYLGDTFYLCIEGTIYIQMNEQTIKLQKGEVLSVPSGVLHAISGENAFKMLQIVVTE